MDDATGHLTAHPLLATTQRMMNAQDAPGGPLELTTLLKVKELGYLLRQVLSVSYLFRIHNL